MGLRVCALIAGSLVALAACSSAEEVSVTSETVLSITTSTTATSTTSSTTLPPLLRDTFTFDAADALLPIDTCKIRDITPDTPNGSSNNSSGFPVPEGAVPRQGEVRLWVIPVSTIDYPASDEAVESLSKALTKVAAFFEDQSFGRAKLTHRVEPRNHWVEFPGTASEHGFSQSGFQQDFSAVMEQILSRWQPSELVSEEDLVLALLPPVPSVVVAQGTRRFDQKRFNNVLLQNGILLSSTPVESGSWSLHAHELGHSWLRLEDLYHFPNFGPFADYMGSWDIMSNAGAAEPMFSSWARWRAGWVSDDEVRCADLSLKSTHLIEPISNRNSTIKSLVIPLSSHSVIVVEARTDRTTSPLVPLVYVVDTSFGHGNGPWRVKGWFANSDDLVVEGVKLTLVDRDSSGVIIEVGPTP